MDRKALEKQLTDAGYSPEAVALLATIPDDRLGVLVADAVKRGPLTPAVPPPIAPPVPIPPVASVVPGPTAAQFAEQEQRLAQADARLKAQEERLAMQEAESRRRQQAERARTVEAFGERWVREGYVLPADMDRTAKTPNLFHRLMVADGSTVRKFGETSATDFDALVQEIESRGAGYARRYFSEQIAQPLDGKDDVTKQASEYAARRNSAGKAKAS